MSLLSVIVPCLNEEAAIPFFYEEMKKVEERFADSYPGLSFEYIFIDDGSKDKTVDVIRSLRKGDNRIHYISFSRNFGKEAALYAGLSKAAGDWLVCMDVDLQDPPDLLPEMFAAVADEGYDSAATRRVTRRGEPKIRSWFARMFYRLMNRISDIEFVDGARDYRVMTRKMADAILELGENNRFTKGIYSWVGFNTKWIEFENVERIAGESKWSFFGLFRYSFEAILGFSTAPLSFVISLGFIVTIMAFLLIIFVIIRTLLFGDPTSGWPSMICIIVFFAGTQLLCTGIVGAYLGKTYLETKNRPIFIAREEE
ncbi:MAG: glycosyltransferase family 2 protein [Lachnospiraceae bacterium]|nr:glycosyltransferase family 2 protein [Lachnospiraceae bacterium]MBR4574907.1 glycosyltransferase family 2 protein [Lachnospiraceae bacterium]